MTERVVGSRELLDAAAVFANETEIDEPSVLAGPNRKEIADLLVLAKLGIRLAGVNDERAILSRLQVDEARSATDANRDDRVRLVCPGELYPLEPRACTVDKVVTGKR